MFGKAIECGTFEGEENDNSPNNCLLMLNKDIISSIFNQQMLYFQI